MNARNSVLALVLLAAGCGVDARYVKADRLTRTAAESRLREYSSDHPDDAQATADLLFTWEKRLAAAENADK